MYTWNIHIDMVGIAFVALPPFSCEQPQPCSLDRHQPVSLICDCTHKNACQIVSSGMRYAQHASLSTFRMEQIRCARLLLRNIF